MGRSKTRTRLQLAAAVLLLHGGDLSGQAPATTPRGTPDAGAELLARDLGAVKRKFISLAEAIPAEKWDWRPMEGVRSVRDVLALIGTEASLFPVEWGFAPQAGTETDVEMEIQRLSGLSKDAFIPALDAAFDNLVGNLAGIDNATAVRTVHFFGRDLPLTGAVTLASNDIHEHLGQLIAYARVLGIVPPWSKNNGM